MEHLINMTSTDLIKTFTSRGRRKFCRGLQQKPITFLRKLRQVKKLAKFNESITVVRTHLRNMIIVPEMIGNQIAIYNGKTFNQIEIKPDMIGHYTGEFSITYKPVKHGRPGIGATSSSKFVPLK
nr:40S ribosomal protein S15 [Cryptomonas curvata]|mmetsp:Transcript_45719/g.95808  ORF Transcript_45719/g.95808 Transcript_45719/m.95808 type:complete len:125 (+) Transcript_45719:194-568(+)